jgi:hypothetical protein
MPAFCHLKAYMRGVHRKMRKPPPNDPIRANERRNAAARRVGTNARCACGEARPEALIAGSNPMICAECQRNQRGQATQDDHHFAGKSNSSVTIPIPVNDHRADLSVAQMDWSKRTRENPDRSPLLAAAACIRGFIDTVVYLIEKGLSWIAEMLEKADEFLTDKLGARWWVGTPVEGFQPKG